MGSSAEKSLRLLGFAYCCWLALWLLANLANLVALALGGRLAVPVDGNTGRFTDFVHFYVGSQLANSPDRFQVYNWEVEHEWLNRVIHPSNPGKILVTQSMPFLFPLMIPFTFLPIDAAQLVWVVLSLCFGVFGLMLLMRRCCVLAKREQVLLAIGVAASLPSCQTMIFGQLAWFLLGVLCIFVWAFLERREIVAGIALAFTTIKPQYSLPLAVAVVLGRRFKLMAAAAVIEILLLILAGQTIGWDNVWGYPRILFSAEAQHPVAAESMVSIRGLLSPFVPQSWALGLSTVVMLIALGLLIWPWYWATYKDKSASAFRWAISIAILVGLLASPHTHVYDCLLLAVPACLTLPSVSLFNIVRLKDSAFRLWCFVLILYPFVGWTLFLLPGVPRYVYLCGLAGLNLLLLALALTRLRQHDRRDTAAVG